MIFPNVTKNFFLQNLVKKYPLSSKKKNNSNLKFILFKLYYIFLFQSYFKNLQNFNFKKNFFFRKKKFLKLKYKKKNIKSKNNKHNAFNYYYLIKIFKHIVQNPNFNKQKKKKICRSIKKLKYFISGFFFKKKRNKNVIQKSTFDFYGSTFNSTFFEKKQLINRILLYFIQQKNNFRFHLSTQHLRLKKYFSCGMFVDQPTKKNIKEFNQLKKFGNAQGLNYKEYQNKAKSKRKQAVVRRKSLFLFLNVTSNHLKKGLVELKTLRVPTYFIRLILSTLKKKKCQLYSINICNGIPHNGVKLRKQKRKKIRKKLLNRRIKKYV